MRLPESVIHTLGDHGWHRVLAAAWQRSLASRIQTSCVHSVYINPIALTITVYFSGLGLSASSILAGPRCLIEECYRKISSLGRPSITLIPTGRKYPEQPLQTPRRPACWHDLSPFLHPPLQRPQGSPAATLRLSFLQPLEQHHSAGVRFFFFQCKCVVVQRFRPLLSLMLLWKSRGAESNMV